MFITILEAALIASAISLDSFVAGFAYGTNKIKINLRYVLLINLICCVMIGAGFFFGGILKDYISESAAAITSFAVLFLLGLVKLLDGFTKSLIKRYTDLSREIKFSLFNFNFILKLYADPKASDADLSKNISISEAASIAIALSLDGVAVGLGAALGGVNWFAVILLSAVTGVCAIIFGRCIGERAANKFKRNLSWLGGVALIILAVAQLV